MKRRTTVTAETDDLAVLAREAARRGTSLGQLLGEAVAEKAQQVRHGRRLRVGTFSADVSIAQLLERDEESPPAQPFR